MKARLLILLTAALMLVLSLHSQTDTSALLAPIFGLTAPDFSTCNPASNLNQLYYVTSSAPFARYQCTAAGWTRKGNAESPLSFLGVPVPLGSTGLFVVPNALALQAHAAFGAGAQIDSVSSINFEPLPTASVIVVNEDNTTAAGALGLYSNINWRPASTVATGGYQVASAVSVLTQNLDGQSTADTWAAGGIFGIRNKGAVTKASVSEGIAAFANAEGAAPVDFLIAADLYVDDASSTSAGNAALVGASMTVANESDSVSYAAGMSTAISNNGGSIGSAFGVLVEQLIKGGGTITNQYGLRIQDQNKAANNWAIFTDLGRVHFGDAVDAPSYRETLTTPASSSAACTAGQFTDDANFHYVCTATNTWKRVALSTF